jgi:iron complex outermembrane receptor protein
MALFADGTYKLGDFEITAGARYGGDRDIYTGSSNGVVRANGVRKKWSSFTPRVVLGYHPASGSMLYASYSKGFKSGLFNASSLSPTAINPEKIDAYEIGFKSQVNRVLFVNAAAYWYDTSDLQVMTQNPLTNLQVLSNAAASRNRGFELSATLQPVDGLSINAGLSYLDAKYRNFLRAQDFLPRTTAPGAVPGSAGNSAVFFDATGNRVVRAPKWTMNLGASYKIDMAGGGSIVPSFNLFTTSKFYWDTVNRLEQKAYTLANAQLKWNLPGENFYVAGWVNNIGDTTYLTSFSPTTQTDRAIVGEPRTYGLKVGYTF